MELLLSFKVHFYAIIIIPEEFIIASFIEEAVHSIEDVDYYLFPDLQSHADDLERMKSYY